MLFKILLSVINFEVIIASIGIILSILGLMWSVFQRTSLDRKKYAIDMIKDWNEFISQYTNLIRSNYTGHYNNCKSIKIDEIDKILTSSHSNPETQKKYKEIKTAIYRLLNYFEYVSAAYNKKSVDQFIIRNSFSAAMLRFFIILKFFLIREFLNSGRNHWKPFTSHLEKIIKDKSTILCPWCKEKECIINPKKDTNDIEVLRYFNSTKLTQNQVNKLEDIYSNNGTVKPNE